MTLKAILERLAKIEKELDEYFVGDHPEAPMAAAIELQGLKLDIEIELRRQGQL